MTATRAREAAVQMLLEDVEPLVRRTEDIAETLESLRAQLQADMETLSGMLQQGRDAQPVLLELGRTLTSAAGRIETGLQTARSTEPPMLGRPRSGWAITSPLLSALLTASLLLLAAWSASGDLIEQARLGRALHLAWPSLDAETRHRVQRAIGSL